MRMLRCAGCAVLISTAAYAQPAPDSGAPASAASPVAPAPVGPAPALAAPGMMPAAPLPAPEPEVEIVNYRWQIAVADVAGVALVFSGTEAGVGLGGLTYVLGGPIIHGMHDQGGRMGASLALRVGLPLALAFGGAELGRRNTRCFPDDFDCEDGSLAGAALGFGLGILTAMVVDTALIARPVEVRKHTGATWAPQVAVTPRHVGLGVAGRF